ncbi:TIM barrel protein [Paludicola sp. MB14-C6]|uniref:TIM barrel protein n=1 Tax=Paludihabitans sp. MB14-C6 TaxID=3070656 RepID=UPI0027DD9393|nr:TIM barrel protein [Paludicola sp. MB14-C6]WMJ23672.1 TIM barrel protein [Paludicola sp. MB14-C6]
MLAKFGPAGNSDSFLAKGYKTNKDIPKYLKEFDLDAYEYQCGRGVKVNPKAANEFGMLALEHNIALSLHAPYYISLSSIEKEKRDNSIRYIVESATAANAMGATRIVVHSGSCGKLSREQALDYAKDTLQRAQLELDELELGHIHICPETMGKVNQLGDLYEVMQLCKVDERMIPCIDFGHLNARTFGGIANQADYAKIIDTIEAELGFDRLKVFHSHFSKIEYTDKGGEKRHLTFEDTIYGPQFEPLAELIAKKGLAPTFICESAGTQAEDSAFMKQIYLSLLKGE